MAKSSRCWRTPGESGTKMKVVLSPVTTNFGITCASPDSSNGMSRPRIRLNCPTHASPHATTQHQSSGEVAAGGSVLGPGIRRSPPAPSISITQVACRTPPLPRGGLTPGQGNAMYDP
jgi:hypothetical protein